MLCVDGGGGDGDQDGGARRQGQMCRRDRDVAYLPRAFLAAIVELGMRAAEFVGGLLKSISRRDGALDDIRGI